MQYQPTPFANTPIRLTLEELDNPTIVLNNFFDRYTLCDIRNSLDDLVFQAMSSEMPELENWRERNSILYFRSQLESTLEASYVLLKEGLPSATMKNRAKRRKNAKKQLSKQES